MKFIIKLFPEITIKSESVRLRFIKILASNIRTVLKQHIEEVAVVRHWDHIIVTPKIDGSEAQIQDLLTRIPGIHHILAVEEQPFVDLHHAYEQVLEMYRDRLDNKTFCVRVKRRGKHEFSSIEAERYIGGGLNQQIASAKVKLLRPDVTVNVEIEQDLLRLVTARQNVSRPFRQQNVLRARKTPR